jgi:hypothetical protein
VLDRRTAFAAEATDAPERVAPTALRDDLRRVPLNRHILRRRKDGLDDPRERRHQGLGRGLSDPVVHSPRVARALDDGVDHMAIGERSPDEQNCVRAGELTKQLGERLVIARARVVGVRDDHSGRCVHVTMKFHEAAGIGQESVCRRAQALHIQDGEELSMPFVVGDLEQLVPVRGDEGPTGQRDQIQYRARYGVKVLSRDDITAGL